MKETIKELKEDIAIQFKKVKVDNQSAFDSLKLGVKNKCIRQKNKISIESQNIHNLLSQLS